MDLAKIQELLKIVADSGVAEVEIEQDDFKLVVRRSQPTVTVQPSHFQMPSMPMGYPMQQMQQMPMQQMPMQQQAAPAPALPAAAPAPAAEEDDDGLGPNDELVRAPIVGTFYRKPAPDQDAYVSEGTAVKVGDVMCIIEAMKLMNEIECEVAGTIKKILVEDSQPVEYDQPLFIVTKG